MDLLFGWTSCERRYANVQFSRLGAASKESYHEDTYPVVLHNYLKFDDELSVVSVVWRDCQQMIEEYNDEQVQHSIEGFF